MKESKWCSWLSRRRPSRFPLSVLFPADSPRLDGEDSAHIRLLADLDTPLLAIVVHSGTMPIIDGMHRFRAARRRGDREIEARFFDGDAEDAFVLEVRLNASHELPLTQKDRATAAARIIASHPQRSDRRIAATSGLSHRTVAAIRRSSAGVAAHSNSGLGRDGRLRPLSTAEGRILACRLIAERPDASLREIAETAGIAVSTAGDVRERLRLGQDLVPQKLRGGHAHPPEDSSRRGSPPWRSSAGNRDPSPRFTDAGRSLLRLLDAIRMVSTDGWTRSSMASRPTARSPSRRSPACAPMCGCTSRMKWKHRGAKPPRVPGWRDGDDRGQLAFSRPPRRAFA
ncbi:ParB/RepB/Spo0J family partition protein [Planotetraspora sp. GP83]|uniref:ParB/RepB/Spo0J family partition protein n=1 Tax=Planotetraspora sp. GP83 TaxID=3156264 RepID=UPI0035170A93